MKTPEALQTMKAVRPGKVEEMKKLLLAILAALTTTSGKPAETPANVYPSALVILETSEYQMICADYGGNEWNKRRPENAVPEFYYIINQPPEDLETGDILAVIMNDNGTPEINDDFVIDYNYVIYSE